MSEEFSNISQLREDFRKFLTKNQPKIEITLSKNGVNRLEYKKGFNRVAIKTPTFNGYVPQQTRFN